MQNANVRQPTLDEVKQEIMRRTGRISPFAAVIREDVEQILKSLVSLDRDHWAEQWCKVGLAYEAKGDQLLKQGAADQEIGKAYYQAFDYCRIGRYPVASTPGKKEAYRHSLRAYRKAAKYFNPPLQTVESPFEGRKLIGYLQVPSAAAKPPLVMHWGGVDNWKEDRQHASTILHRLGLATFTIDMPGTGESPVLYSDPNAERTFAVAIDHLTQRNDIDGSRIGV